MLICRIAALILLATPAERPDLTGRVRSESGDPIAGAHVFIATAAPKSGTSTLCPSCYADCVKRADSDAEGAFRIPSLDPGLLFRVLVIADGFRPTYAGGVDPATGPLEVSLSPFDPASLPADQVVRGTVVGPDGSPVAGATVEPEEFDTAAFRGFSPGVFDPTAVTDLAGRFALTANSPIRSVSVKVEGRGLAPRIFAGLRPGKESTLRLGRGAEVSGHVLLNGRPAPGVVVGLVQVDRGMGRFLGHREVGADAEGRFSFPNVAPNDAYYVYGTMASLAGRGAVPAREVRVGGDESVVDAGVLAVEPAHTLAGRVMLSDGKPVPKGTRLLVGREGAWDTQSATLDGEGRFRMEGLPAEQVSVSVRVPGYRISAKNKTRDANNPFVLSGHIDGDIEGLTILLEPGAE